MLTDRRPLALSPPVSGGERRSRSMPSSFVLRATHLQGACKTGHRRTPRTFQELAEFGPVCADGKVAQRQICQGGCWEPRPESRGLEVHITRRGFWQVRRNAHSDSEPTGDGMFLLA